MDLSSFFYNVIIVFAFLLAFLSVRFKSKYLLVLPFLLIFLVSALRQGVGTDFYFYKDIFEYHYLTREIKGEFLFYGLNVILNSINVDFQWFIVITSFIFCVFISACATTTFGVWLFLFTLFNLYLPSFNIIRQGVAVSIVCYAIYRYFYFDEKRLYIALLLSAVMFHASLVIAFVILIFDKLKISNWLLVVIIVTFYVFAGQAVTIFLDSSFLKESSYSYYVGSEYLNSTKLGSGIGVLIQIIPYFLIMLFNVKLFGVNAKSIFIRNACFFFILVKILVLHLSILNRLEVALIFLTGLIFCESARLCNKSIFNLSIFVYMLFWQIFQFEMMLKNGLHEVTPYMSIWGGV